MGQICQDISRLGGKYLSLRRYRGIKQILESYQKPSIYKFSQQTPVANLFELLSVPGYIASKSQQMRFRDKTAYMFGVFAIKESNCQIPAHYATLAFLQQSAQSE